MPGHAGDVDQGRKRIVFDIVDCDAGCGKWRDMFQDMGAIAQRAKPVDIRWSKSQRVAVNGGGAVYAECVWAHAFFGVSQDDIVLKIFVGI